MSFEEDNNPFAQDGFDTAYGEGEGVERDTDTNGFSAGFSGVSELSYTTADVATTTPQIKTYHSRIEQLLMEHGDLNIVITDAGKSHEGTSRGFIAYTIRLGDIVVRRRYSEFESLRDALVRLFPTLVVPPIPEKHSMSDYAAAPTRAKDDVTIIEHRQRMLAVFLNRCCALEPVRRSVVLHRFLDPNASWSEVLTSPPISQLPKNILRAPPLDPANASVAHSYLPVPTSTLLSSSTNTLEDTDLDETEANAKEYEAVIASGLEKANRRIVKRYTDLAADYSDLGAKFNAFSLEENGSLAHAIEKVGEAIDGSFISTEALVAALSQSFSEPLGESAQFAAVVRGVLRYRRQKAMQVDLTRDSLHEKKMMLESLERSELEAQRINVYLKRDGTTQGVGTTTARTTESLPGTTTEIVENADQSPDDSRPAGDSSVIDSAGSSSAFPPTHAHSPRPRSTFKFPGISQLNHAIHGIIDVDPEATRRSSIGKAREQITQLEAALEVARTDAAAASDSVKVELKRFQETKQQDLRRIMAAYIQCHVEWARKNLDAWTEAKSVIEGL